MMLFADGDTQAAITNIGGIASFAALVWWILKSALPALLRDLGDRLDRVQDKHAVELASARREFRDEIAVTRIDNAATRKEFLEELSHMREAIVDVNETQGNLSHSVDNLTKQLCSLETRHAMA